MNIVQNLERIWDNGAVSPESLSVEAIDEFKNKTNAQKVVGSRWTFNGKRHETKHYANQLPDQTGLVHFKDGTPSSGQLVVINGDGSHRKTISVPRINENSRPEAGYLNLPPSSAHINGIEWGCEGSDGHTDYLFDFDWNSGEILRYAQPVRTW